MGLQLCARGAMQHSAIAKPRMTTLCFLLLPAASYAAIGFNYGGTADADVVVAPGSDSDVSGSDDEDEGEDGEGGQGMGAEELEDERLDGMAEAFGITDYSYVLHRSLKAEGEQEAARRRQPRRATLLGGKGWRMRAR